MAGSPDKFRNECTKIESLIFFKKIKFRVVTYLLCCLILFFLLLNYKCAVLQINKEFCITTKSLNETIML